jgi:outer membrane receptor protein involved in Fe transport
MRSHSLASTILLLAVPALSQSTNYGQLTGIVRDVQGGVLAGTSVTLFGEDVMGERGVTTEVDGRYIFRALSPGTYNLRFELPGFVVREARGLIVEAGTTITVDANLAVAAIAENVVVTAESPTVDVKTTRLGATFDVVELQDVPSSTDLWAVLAQSPGIRMLGFDVGGSHKAQQTEYESYGIVSQNKIVSDGVDSTEGTGGAGVYYDYYSIEEFQVSAGGADVEMTSPGASVVMTVKSGGNELSGLYLVEYEDESFVGNNADEELIERGFTGNPNLLFWEVHAELGGPIVRDKAWFYVGYNHFTLDKQRSGVEPELATDKGIFDNYIAKLTLELNERDRFIGYSQWGRKQAPNRGLSVTTPPGSATDQDSWHWVHKAEWQRIWSNRLFTNVQVKHFGIGADFLPTSDPAANPARVDTATGIRSGASHLNPNDFNRFKPHMSAQASYYLPTGSGGHDFKLGFDWQHDEINGGLEGHPLPVLYRDNSRLGRPGNVDAIDLFNFPFTADFVNRKLDFYAQDVWTLSERLTVSAGVRFGSQKSFYSDAELTPVLSEIFPPRSIPGETVLTWFNAAPRIGAALDLTGQGKTVLKGYWGRFYVNLAQQLQGTNPVVFGSQTYDFLDQNENTLYDGAHELGELVFEVGGGTDVVESDMKPSFSDELNISLEHELAADTSLRASYVRKELKHVIGRFNRAEVRALAENPVPCGDAIFPCPPDPFTEKPLNLVRLPPDVPFDVAFDNFPGADYTYDTIQVAFSRRFTGRFFVQGNFDYQWREEVSQGTGVNTGGGNFSANYHPDVPYLQNSTSWQGKLLARYVLPHDLAIATNLRYQSGWPWAPIHRERIPGSGTRAFLLENIENNRSEDVVLLDLRLEKSFLVNGRHRVTGLVDIFNLTNSNAVTDFIDRTGGAFQGIVAALDPRTFKIGVRWQF